MVKMNIVLAPVGLPYRQRGSAMAVAPISANTGAKSSKNVWFAVLTGAGGDVNNYRGYSHLP
jgi:hypothetical protein